MGATEHMAGPGSGCAAVSIGRCYYRCFPPARLVSSLRFAALAAGAATYQCPWAGTPSGPETPLCGLSRVPDVRDPGHPRWGWAQPYPPVSASHGHLTRHHKLILSQRILNQQKCILSQSCRPEVQNQGVIWCCAPSAGSGGVASRLFRPVCCCGASLPSLHPSSHGLPCASVPNLPLCPSRRTPDGISGHPDNPG